MEDAIRLSRPGGEVTLVGMPGARSTLDLTPLWHGEISLSGAYAYGTEKYEGEKTTSFDLALRLANPLKLDALVGPRFRLPHYGEAIAAARSTGRDGNVKVVFDLRS
jgi:threonine dehydrogenase-like Zn-dependent dehydrogenase